jgi:hypothetical protein
LEFSRCLWERGPGFTAVFTVLRLLTPLKKFYEAAKIRAQPYTKIVEELRRCDGRRQSLAEDQ